MVICWEPVTGPRETDSLATRGTEANLKVTPRETRLFPAAVTRVIVISPGLCLGVSTVSAVPESTRSFEPVTRPNFTYRTEPRPFPRSVTAVPPLTGPALTEIEATRGD